MTRHPRLSILRLTLVAGLAVLVGAGLESVTAAPAAKDAKSAAKTSKVSPASKAVGKPAPKAASKQKNAPKAASKQTASTRQVPLPRPKPGNRTIAALLSMEQAPAVSTSGPAAPPATVTAPPASVSGSAVPPISAKDLALVKRAMAEINRGKIDAAHTLTRDIRDRAAAKVVEWAILRSSYTSAVPFERFIAFINENPTWPSLDLFRRRAEGALWEDRRDAKMIRAYFADQIPMTAKGRLALARALLALGDRKAAEPLVREVWQRHALTLALEIMVINAFGDMLTRADHKARMDMRLYDNDPQAAIRMASRLGPTEMAIAKARAAMITKAANAKAMLDAVPAEGQRDPGYMFNRIQFLRRADKIAEAAELMLAVPKDPRMLHHLDEWWIERRYLARKLLDIGDAKTAYRVARDAVPPPRENYRVDHQFTAGWIALRFLNDPATALTHFARIPEGLTKPNPHALSRADYWRARALDALGRREEARKHYEAAAQHSTVYYGQIARARLGLPDLPLRPAPRAAQAPRPDVVRAADVLYAADERDLANIMLADLGQRSDDIGILAGLGEAASRYKDARGMLLLGKGALGRGHPFDHYAHPTIGLPSYSPIGPPIDPSIAYSIARTESHFSQKVVSTAQAVGLMQVTPAAGRYITKKFKAVYNWQRLQRDQVYNMQIGAAELGDLIQYYRGSYILTFAGYNAGRGRVKDWIERFGDPRDPNVDPIDWVERIPFAETRNYVPRILEALQVYRIRFGGAPKLLIEADLHRGSSRIQ
jgi:soluble lytic murein transglycosylase